MNFNPRATIQNFRIVQLDFSTIRKIRKVGLFNYQIVAKT